MTSAHPSQAEPAVPRPARARCVLVVEDEPFLATLIEDILVTAGYRVLKAARVESALQLVRSGASIDAALLDININGVEVYPLAITLRELGVPFVFASGYGREGLPAEFNDCPVLQKPYLPDSITAAVARSLAA